MFNCDLEYSNWMALAVLAIVMLCQVSASCKYYAKMTVFGVVALLLSTFLPLPWFILRPRHYKNALGPAWGICQLFRLFGVTYEIRSQQHIRQSCGSVVLINHQSFIDLVVLGHLWPIIGRATVVAKRLVLFFFPPSWGWGTLFIDRTNRVNAVGMMNTQAIAIAEHAAKLLVFPEGTRGDGTALLPFKKGPFHIAVQAQATLQPVVVSRYWFMGENAATTKGKRFDGGHTIISILPEIDCKGLDKEHIDDLRDRTQRIMQDEYVRINDETYAINAKIVPRMVTEAEKRFF